MNSTLQMTDGKITLGEKASDKIPVQFFSRMTGTNNGQLPRCQCVSLIDSCTEERKSLKGFRNRAEKCPPVSGSKQERAATMGIRDRSGRMAGFFTGSPANDRLNLEYIFSVTGQ